MPSERELYELYWKIERFIAPSLKYSQYLYEEVLATNVTTGIRWLDLGCGHRLLPSWRLEQEKQFIERSSMIVGIDADWPSLQKHRSIRLRIKGDIGNLPFTANSFDLVTANMVVEHLTHPVEQFAEVNRVLCPGGLFIFHTPNAHGYSTILARLLPAGLKLALIRALQGRDAKDVFKTHYKANTEGEIIRVAKLTDFEVVEIRLVASSAQFAVVPPIAALELLWIRLLLTRRFRHLRTNLIVTLRKHS